MLANKKMRKQIQIKKKLFFFQKSYCPKGAKNHKTFHFSSNRDYHNILRHKRFYFGEKQQIFYRFSKQMQSFMHSLNGLY